MSTYELGGGGGGNASIQPMASCIKYLKLKNAFLFVENEIYELPFWKMFWLCWVFSAVLGIHLVAVSEGYSWLQRMGFSLPWLLLLQSTGSRQSGFSSCRTCIQLLWMWDFPRPGIEPLSPVLVHRFLTTGLPGKSHELHFTNCLCPMFSEILLIESGFSNNNILIEPMAYLQLINLKFAAYF